MSPEAAPLTLPDIMHLHGERQPGTTPRRPSHLKLAGIGTRRDAMVNTPCCFIGCLQDECTLVTVVHEASSTTPCGAGMSKGGRDAWPGWSATWPPPRAPHDGLAWATDSQSTHQPSSRRRASVTLWSSPWSR